MTMYSTSENRKAHPNFHAMRTLLQRVSRAEVRIRSENSDVESRVAGRIRNGYVLFVGFTQTDTEAELRWMADKVVHLRLFADDAGKLHYDIIETTGAMLIVSQFTLYADVQKGRRPSFGAAAPPDFARMLYNRFVMLLRQSGLVVETGEFGADMEVELINDGPVTIWLDREHAPQVLAAE